MIKTCYTNRVEGATAGKMDVEYYTPFPQLRRIRSMKKLKHFYPKTNWDNFNYESGKFEYNPNVKGKQGWDKDLEEIREKMIAEEANQNERGKELLKKNRSPATIWDILYVTEGKITGRMPGSPNVPKPKSDLRNGPVKKRGKKRTKPKTKRPKSSSMIYEMFSKKVNDSVKNQTCAMKETFVSTKSGEKEKVKDIDKVANLQPKAQKVVERKHVSLKTSNEFVLVDSSGKILFEIMKKSMNIGLADQCFVDNRNLLQHYSMKYNPIKDSTLSFLWVKADLVTDEVKKMRKTFFEDLIASGQFKLTCK